MQSLLAVLVIVCALVAAVRMARGWWARSRSVERHHQALGTLADITQQGSEVAPGEPEDEGARRADAADGHQAHVRIIGPSGQPSGGEALPPPRNVFTGVGRPSPFRRPSRTGPSAAALDAIATSASLGTSPNTRVMRSGPFSPPAQLPRIPGPVSGYAPGDTVGGQATGTTDDSTLPGIKPPSAPVPLDERSTRPVPVASSQVFYFDDLGAKSPPPPPPAGVPSLAALAATVARARAADADERLVIGGEPALVTGDAMVPSVLPVPPPPEAAADGGRFRGRRRLVVRAIAAAAVVVGTVAIATSLSGSNGNGNGNGRQAGPAVPQAGAGHPGHSQVTRGSHGRTRTQATVPTTVTTTTRPPQVAALLSTNAGTATYHINSSSDSIVVMAKGPCWLEVRADSPSGQVVYEGTLLAGQRSSVTGPAWIRLGDPPQVSVLVNGKRLGPPGAQLAAPLNLEFTLARDA